MKKILAILLILVLALTSMVSCDKVEGVKNTVVDKFNEIKNNIFGGKEEGPTLDDAKTYLFNTYKDSAAAPMNDYDVVAKVIVDGVTFNVTWTVDLETITIKESTKANFWTVDLPEVNATEVAYVLTATITDADDNKVEVKLNKKLPVIDSTGVTTTPVAGTAYKLFLKQIDLGLDLYALNATQDNANKFILTTLDPKEAADFYVEVVDGGYKVYTEIDGVKNYLHATAVPKTTGNGFTKTIGFATETDTVLSYNSEIGTYVITIDGNKFGVGTYGAYETISISEASYFKADNINVAEGQFPVGFMTSAYAETLTPDERPVVKDPTPDTVLTIAEAIALGETKIKGQYTEGKYYVTGVVDEITNTQYGNMYITDGTNKLLIYGTYDADGTNRFDAMTDKPEVGDTITVYGVIGFYSAAQMQNGWITEIKASVCEHANTEENVVNATCTVNGSKTVVCKDCGETVSTEVLTAPGHTETDVIAVEATCQVEGFTAGKYCSVCETYTEGHESLGNADHNYGEDNLCVWCQTPSHTCEYTVKGATTDPTCTEAGYTVYTCYYEGCGKTENLDPVDPLNHVGTETTTTTVDATCTAAGSITVTCVCGEVLSTEPQAQLEHKDETGDFKCDYDCGTVVEPAADSVLTIEQALALGKLYSHSTYDGLYSTGKFYVTGTIESVTNAKYGNLEIVDANGNKFTVYGSYSADGETGYADLEVKPIKGDVVTVYGVIGCYGPNSVQMNNGWITEHTAHEHAYSEATCTAAPKCSVCGAINGEALGHKDEDSDGKCDVCTANMNVTVATDTLTIAANTGALASDKLSISWTFENFTVTGEKGSSSTAIRTSDSDHFRIYQGSKFKLTSNNGQQITKVVITVTESKFASIIESSLTTSGVNVTVSGTTVTFEVASGSIEALEFTASAQFRVKSLDVTYQA